MGPMPEEGQVSADELSAQQKLEILNLLHEDSRLSSATIADMTGLDEQAVREAIHQLEEERIIVRYSAVINWDRLVNRGVTAIIDVNVTPQRERGFDSIAERIYRFPEVRSVTLMSGAFDLQVVVEGKHLREVALFVAEKLSTIEDVTSTTTHFLLKTYKSDGVIFDDREDDQRLVVTP